MPETAPLIEPEDGVGKGSAALIAGLLLANAAGMTLLLSMSKLVQAGGLSAFAFGFWVSFASAVGLGAALAVQVRRRAVRMIWPWRYWAVSALVSLALPQLIIFLAAAQIGAGLAAIGFALPTLTTWITARIWGIEPHNGLRMGGALIGAVGALWLLLPQGGAVPPDALPWLGLSCVAAVVLGFGNVYRGVCWPKGATALELAVGMLVLGTLAFGGMAVATGNTLVFWQFPDAVPPLAVQMLAASFLYLAYFGLQKAAPPVLFGLLGQIGLVFNLIVGALFLDETYSLTALGAVALMLIGLLGIVLGGIKRPAK
ncbi:MAG: hypothetical protein Alpg2KO_25740 [Alphaproteobacteria bacterium]